MFYGSTDGVSYEFTYDQLYGVCQTAQSPFSKQ